MRRHCSWAVWAVSCAKTQTIAAAQAMQAIAPRELERVIVDTTVQEKAMAFPTDSWLLEVARQELVVLAGREIGATIRMQCERKPLRLRTVVHWHDFNRHGGQQAAVIPAQVRQSMAAGRRGKAGALEQAITDVASRGIRCERWEGPGPTGPLSAIET